MNPIELAGTTQTLLQFFLNFKMIELFLRNIFLLKKDALDMQDKQIFQSKNLKIKF